jgi:hypothetical protein
VSGKRRFKDAKARREPGGFVPLPSVAIRSEPFAKLGAHAVKLLIELLAQFRGDNNGDLEMTWGKMRKRGWASRDTLNRARGELLGAGWIMVSRQGGRHKCSLYAVTFYAIDDCKGKLDVSATGSPPSLWKQTEPAPQVKIVTRQSCQLRTH